VRGLRANEPLRVREQRKYCRDWRSWRIAKDRISKFPIMSINSSPSSTFNCAYRDVLRLCKVVCQSVHLVLNSYKESSPRKSNLVERCTHILTSRPLLPSLLLSYVFHLSCMVNSMKVCFTTSAMVCKKYWRTRVVSHSIPTPLCGWRR
jgi:hypothetical protein